MLDDLIAGLRDVVSELAGTDSVFPTVADLVADESMTYGDVEPGDYVFVNEGDFTYRVAFVPAADHQIETAEGVKLYAVRGEEGKVTASQLGCGQADDSTQLRRLFDCLKHGFTRHIVIDVACTLPGRNSTASLTRADIPGSATIEFTGQGRLVYDSDDEAEFHDYLQLHSCSDVAIIAPRVVKDTPAIYRSARPGISLVLCERVKVYRPYVYGTQGAGFLGKACTDCAVYDGYAEATKADGFHWRNGDEADPGTSTNCWTYRCHSKNTGDDGFAVVSYANENQPPLENCGHLDFVSEGSAARGAAIIGGTDCHLRGRVSGSTMQGVLVAKEHNDRFHTHAPIRPDIEVSTKDCRQTGVEIGRATQGASCAITSTGAGTRGLAIGNAMERPSDTTIALTARDSGTQALVVDRADGVTIETLSINGAGSGAAKFNDVRGLVVAPVRINDYGKDGISAEDGVMVKDCINVHLSGGTVTGAGAKSERAVDLITNDRIVLTVPFLVNGGIAPNPYKVRDLNNTNASLASVDGAHYIEAA